MPIRSCARSRVARWAASSRCKIWTRASASRLLLNNRMERIMATQSFPAGAAPRIVLNGCSGDLEIEIWDERAIEIETDGSVDRLNQSDEALVIENVDDNL